jgi:hypothetical protein
MSASLPVATKLLHYGNRRFGPCMATFIIFDLAEQFAGLAAYYQPVPAADGTLTGNPRFNEEKFKEYAVLARDTALGAAAYQSPKLAAVAVGVDANDPLQFKDLSLDQIRERIAAELEKLGPILDLQAIRDPQGIENRIPVVANGVAEDEGRPNQRMSHQNGDGRKKNGA